MIAQRAQSANDVYIVNKHGIVHSVAEGAPWPEGAHAATQTEIAEWQRVEAERAEQFAETERVRREEEAARRARGWG